MKVLGGHTLPASTHPVFGVEVCLAGDEMLRALVVASPHRDMQRGAEQLRNGRARWVPGREDKGCPRPQRMCEGEEGNGSVGRWTAVLAADPSLLASKMEPILRDASTRVLRGLRRHSAWSAEKHLC